MASNVELLPLRVGEDDEEELPPLVWRDSNPKYTWLASLTQSLWSVLKRITYILVPSFLCPTYDFKFREYEPGSTIWLDGLRGVAAFIVFISHFIIIYVPEAHYTWDPVRHPNIFFLPIFHVSYNGTAMVRIFFVVSGFALTNTAVRLLRKKGHHKALLKSIASSILRRYLRLYLPCLGSYILVHTMRAFGAMDWYEDHHRRLPNDLEAVQSAVLPTKSSHGIFGQIPIMLSEFWQFAVGRTLFNEPYDFRTNPFLWTIPIEFQGSIILFLLVTGTSQLRRAIRVYVMLPLVCILYICHINVDVPLFVFGYILAEIHVAYHDFEELPTWPGIPLTFTRTVPTHKLKMVCLYGMVVIALWLLSFPNSDGDNSFSYVTLCRILFPGWNYMILRSTVQNYGAMILCFALIYLPRLQRLFSTRLCQYLGRISYSLYLMHSLVLRTVGHRLILGLWDHYPREANTDRMFIAAICFFLVVLPVAICTSDLFWRMCETPATKFVRTLEGWVIVKEEKDAQGHAQTPS